MSLFGRKRSAWFGILMTFDAVDRMMRSVAVIAGRSSRFGFGTVIHTG